MSFDSNGGTAVASQVVAYGGTATAPTDPTRTGYAFAGWYSDSGLTSAFSFTTAITADLTLYAKWTINSYTVSFNSNGGTIGNEPGRADNGFGHGSDGSDTDRIRLCGLEIRTPALTSAFSFTTADHQLTSRCTRSGR